MIYLDLRPARRLWTCLDVPEAPTDQAKRLCATPWWTAAAPDPGRADTRLSRSAAFRRRRRWTVLPHLRPHRGHDTRRNYKEDLLSLCSIRATYDQSALPPNPAW